MPVPASTRPFSVPCRKYRIPGARRARAPVCLCAAACLDTCAAGRCIAVTLTPSAVLRGRVFPDPLPWSLLCPLTSPLPWPLRSRIFRPGLGLVPQGWEGHGGRSHLSGHTAYCVWCWGLFLLPEPRFPWTLAPSSWLGGSPGTWHPHGLHPVSLSVWDRRSRWSQGDERSACHLWPCRWSLVTCTSWGWADMAPGAAALRGL